jgi:hypothetical protein
LEAAVPKWRLAVLLFPGLAASVVLHRHEPAPG